MPRSDIMDSVINNDVEPTAANVVNFINLTVVMGRKRVRFGPSKSRPTDEPQIGMVASELTEEDTPRAYVVH